MKSEQNLSLQEAIQLALAHHRAGRLSDAEQIYQRVLQIDPNYPDALHLLGVIAYQTGENEISVQLIEKALHYLPNEPAFLNSLGEAYRHMGRLQEALANYDKALLFKSEYVEALNNKGLVLHALKRYDDAVASYDKALMIRHDFHEALSNRGFALHNLGRYDEALISHEKALQIKPDFAAAFSNRGLAFQELERVEDALDSYKKALMINPDFAEAHNNQGNALKELGRPQEAEYSYRRAIALRPDYAMAHNNLGNALRDLGRPQEAIANYRQALALDPANIEAHINLGNVLSDIGQLHYAEENYRLALKLNPDCALAYNNLGNTLKDLRRLQEAEESYRRALALDPDYAMAHYNLGNALVDLGRLEETDRSYRQALALKPDFAAAHSNLIFAMDLAEGHDLKAQQAERRRWFEQHGRKHAAGILAHENAPDPKRTLRVGYVSADFRRHSAYYIFSPVLYAHDRSAFEVYCYSGVKREDDATARLKAAAQGWRSTVGTSDEALAEQIRADRIDILVDLAGHSAGNRLPVFARKPAPVQVTAWGHAHGTGLETMDYFFADQVFLAKKDRPLFAEKVIDLPCVICYEAPAYAPEVQPLPALAGKPFTFGCINRIEKISDRSLGLWGRIMAALPQARLLFKDHKLGDARLRETFLRRLGAVGIGPERVRLAEGSPHAEHLKIYHEVDVGLDPFPHGGGVSTAEALWMGVPVVTLPGPTLPSRVSASVLTAIDLRDWIAKDDADYVRIAIEASRDLPRLAALRQGLRAHMAASAVGDARRYTAAVEHAYRAMWQQWCKSFQQRKSS